MTLGEQFAAMEALQDEAKRKLRVIKSKGSLKGAAMQAYWKDLAETVQAMETLRSQIKCSTTSTPNTSS